MPSRLLALPYELRECILIPLLLREDTIELQCPTTHRTTFTYPVTQVCRLLREESTRLFYQVNKFERTIDAEEVSTHTSRN